MNMLKTNEMFTLKWNFMLHQFYVLKKKKKKNQLPKKVLISVSPMAYSQTVIFFFFETGNVG